MDLVIAVLSSIICFGTGSFLMIPKNKNSFPSEGFALFFFFEGIWIAVNHIISGIWPSNYVMDIIQYLGIIIFGIIIVITLMIDKKINIRTKVTKQNNSLKKSDK